MKNTKSFPAQKLPMSKKTQAWKEACVDYVVGAGDSGFGGNGRSRSTMIYIIAYIMKRILNM